MKKNYQNSRMFWLGLLVLVGGALLWLKRSKINRPPTGNNSLNESAAEIYGLLIDAGFNPETAKIITAQAAHETGGFTSYLYHVNKNAFGMKLPKVRRTTAIGENKGHAVYESYLDSVNDFYLWYKFSKLPDWWLNVQEYTDALKMKSYYEDTAENYFTGVNGFYRLYFGG